MKLAGTVLSALLFGWALNKGGVYRSDVIQDQFLFTNNTMLVGAAGRLAEYECGTQLPANRQRTHRLPMRLADR